MSDKAQPRHHGLEVSDRIYLCAPVNALVEGLYEQNIPLTTIREHGDFGLGTFNELDGEMVMVDGQVYRVGGDGDAQEIVDSAVCTPFACVTFFRGVSGESMDRELSYPEFEHWIRDLMPSPNLFYAFRIEGEFAQVKTRSVSKQELYRPLVEVAREQSTFEFRDCRGLLVGFHTPAFLPSLNVPGLHLHFLNDSRDRGGHLLECRPRSVSLRMQYLYTLELSLPADLDYLTWDFQRDIGRDLNEAEK